MKKKKKERVGSKKIVYNIVIIIIINTIYICNIFLRTKRFLATRPIVGGECPSSTAQRARTGWLTTNGIRDDGRSSGSRRSRAPGNLAHAKDGEQKGRKNIPLDLYKQKNKYIYVCVWV